MTIRVAIKHQTTYQFDKFVKLSPHVIRLRPAPHSRTPVSSYSLKIQPEEHFVNWQQDPFGNYQARVVFPEKTDCLKIDVEVIADLSTYNPFDFFVEEYAEKFPFEYDAALKKELAPYLKKRARSPLMKEWLDKVPKKEMNANDFLVWMNQKVSEDIEYSLRFDPGVQTPSQTLRKKKGSCRDSAWLLAQLFRHCGLATRFVSGYLVQLTSDVKSLDGPSGPNEDFTDLHAWCEVYLPGAGWVGLDPTSGLFASEGHIPLSCTPEPGSAAPVEGALEPCEVEFSYSNTVTRIHEDPRVTKPYTEKQWQAIDALGEFVEQQLHEQDVRLTMGGEPTFVSIDDMESAQWNTAALGEDKLLLAKTLLFRLREKFAPNGFLHYGQGKWYPGEEIPRWALGCFWRTDGLPLWNNPDLLANFDSDYGVNIDKTQDFAKTLAQNLGINAGYLQAAYEDKLYYLREEANVPVDIDPDDADLEDGLDRMRLAKVLRQGLNTPTAWVLPLSWDSGSSQWYSTRWEFRAERIILIPGDSPVGLRLPLQSLPAQSEEYIDLGRDPFDPREPLSEDNQLLKNNSVHNDRLQRMIKNVPRTSLCFEPRDGRLYIFMPPLSYLEHYVDILACIEKTANALSMPVVIEGYEPPRDYRIQKLLVTPDPGVIEVNIHPSHNWSDLKQITTTLYEEARLSRLSAEKFMLDGRHTGTGGGNHITLGGTTPADSPMLRRPELVGSFVTYWQNHPGLSYLFSGMFIGPTSQAPRVDEGRDESLYELEIALSQIPEGYIDQPWIVDRLLRNLLVDVTGNTHRSELCIDKLYSPDSPSGRQGIIEFRGFEMPPHPQMSLVQSLLLRTLVARFWKSPYRNKLVRWGTDLHDRFMLPYYVWSDLKEVVEDLNQHGFPFDLKWLEPFESFRFPHYGNIQVGSIEMELRFAIEPWHVLGEEVGSFGTSRYVDSSVERLQIKLTGLTDQRYIVTCNGKQVPLRNTGKHGEYIGGVRYRAWQPPSALHPYIGVHAPLVFDIVDTWNQRAIGGCTYHVSHAGGRSYQTFPVNAMEAESRRTNRFWGFGHSQGEHNERLGFGAPAYAHGVDGPVLKLQRYFIPNEYEPKKVVIPLQEVSNEYPVTLDLRASLEN